jgi:Tfp pilus assembly protein PilO
MAAGSEWPEKTKLIVTIAAGALVALGAWTGAYFGQKKTAELDQQIKISKANTEKYRALTLLIPGRKAEKEALLVAQEEASRRLPTEEEAAELVQKLSKDSQRFGVTQVSVKAMSRPAGRAGAKATNFEMDSWDTAWKADFHGWCRFMNDVEESESSRLIAFEGLQIKTKARGLNFMGEKHDIRVTMNTFRFATKAKK